MIKTYIKKYGFLLLAITLVILAANLSKNESSKTLTRYRKTVEATDSSRVARWKIDTKEIKNGNLVELDSAFRTEILEGSGNWVFEISNGSEVNAEIDLDSKIRIRLDNDSFNRHSSDTLNWNFLSDSNGVINNPISFNIKMYKTPLTNLLKYENGTSVLSYDEYSVLSETEKKQYTQIINDSLSDEITLNLLDLNSTKNNVFTKDNEQTQNKLVYYYYLDVSLKDIIDATSNYLKMPIDDTFSFVISWNVTGGASSSTVTDDVTYNGYKLVEGRVLPDGFNSYETYIIDGVEYTLCKTNDKNFYEYMKYVSSLTGGEAWFSFPDEFGKERRVKYSELTPSQITELESTTFDKTSLIGLKRYADHLEYTQYKKYLSDNEEHQAALGYLSYGLKVNMQFMIKVKQVKPE